MAERIRQYLAYVDQLLESEDDGVDWEKEMQKHLVQIAFFAHERFIHLIVTVLFALLAFLVFLYTLNNFSVSMLLLIVALMILLIPYIKHYYLLENSVQHMYEQYDQMQQKVGTGFVCKRK